MGKSHLVVGAAGFLAAGVPALKLAGVDLDPAEIGAGAVVCAGAAMLPDLDHPQATISRSLGPVTWVASRAMSKLGGGHRNGTHSLLFALLATLGSWALLTSVDGPWAALLITFFFSSLFLRALTDADGLICAVLSAVLAATLITLAPQIEWLYLSVGLGCLAHMLGDVLTPQGIPPLWPVSKHRTSIAVIGRTGDWRETGCALVAGAVAVYLTATMIFVPLWEQNTAKAEASAKPVAAQQAEQTPKADPDKDES